MAGPATRRLWTTPYTCGRDGLQHEITDEAFRAARQRGVALVAVCGRELECSLAISAPGVPCAACARIVQQSRERQCEMQRAVLVLIKDGQEGRHRRPRSIRWPRRVHGRSQHAWRAS